MGTYQVAVETLDHQHLIRIVKDVCPDLAAMTVRAALKREGYALYCGATITPR